MSRQITRASALTTVLAAALSAGLTYSIVDRSVAQGRFDAEKSQLAECQQVARKILELRGKKQTALLRTKPADELNRRIDAWAKEAGISSNQIIRIQPGEPRRIGDTHYLEQITELDVSETTLPKLIQFMQIAEQDGEGLKLTSFRISLPHSGTAQAGQDELWIAELVLTYLVYSPKSG